MSRKQPNAPRKNTWAERDSRPVSWYGPAHWAWLAAGMVIGILTVNLVDSWNSADPMRTPGGESGKGGAGKTASDTPVDKPRFEYPNLLRDSEVVVPLRDSEVIVPDTRQTEQSPEKPREEFNFLLQAGSFRSGKDAESRRAQLLLLNLRTSVETVSSRGETWYRVLVGPFDSGPKLADARAALLEQGIDHVVLKRKQ